MEHELVRVPFDLVMAKQITYGEIKGRIVTRNDRRARIICFDAKDSAPVVALVEDRDGHEYTIGYLLNGAFHPSEKTEKDLFLEVPDYLTFKDGDILSDEDFVFILDGNGTWKTSLYAAIHKNGNLTFGGAAHEDDIDMFRFATEEEKSRLKEALLKSENPLAKKYLKQFFGCTVENIPFTTGQAVLGKDGNGEWRYDIFSHYKPGRKGKYVCTGRSYNECIPFNDETKHLVGETEENEINKDK